MLLSVMVRQQQRQQQHKLDELYTPRALAVKRALWDCIMARRVLRAIIGPESH
eukprot:COSAG06_NODE_60870_length_269_cov_0.917647_1_plen_52_part_10